LECGLLSVGGFYIGRLRTRRHLSPRGFQAGSFFHPCGQGQVTTADGAAPESGSTRSA
jgi:hypothetical protein